MSQRRVGNSKALLCVKLLILCLLYYTSSRVVCLFVFSFVENLSKLRGNVGLTLLPTSGESLL